MINKILLVAATKFELNYFFSKIECKQIKSNLYKCQFSDCEVDILITGTGVYNTLYKLTKHLVDNEYDLLLNIGIAGSYKKDIKLGEVVGVCTEQFGDIGIEDSTNFKTMFELGIEDSNEFPFHNAKLNLSVYSTLKQVNALTMNTVTGALERINFIKNKYQADIETMEGAAFAYVALSEQYKCYQFRAISNYVEPRNKENWEMDLSIKKLGNFVIEFFNQPIK